MKRKPCGPCTVRCDRHLSEAFLHLTLESSNWWKPRRFFAVSHMFQNDFRWKNRHSVGPRFNAAQVEFGPTAMPFLPIGNDISLENPFRQLKCRKIWSQGTFPSFWCGNYRVYLKEESIRISALRRVFKIILGTFFSTKSLKPNEWNEFRVPPRSPQALWPAWRTKWTWTTWKCQLMWETNDPQFHFHGNLWVPPNDTQEMRA